MRLPGDKSKINSKQGRPSSYHRLRSHLLKKVDIKYAYIPILVCCFISGFCDGASFAAYNVFLSMQTGNTIFMAAGAADLPPGQPYNWARSLISVASFCVGAISFAFLGRRMGERRRIFLFTSFMIQFILIIIAAALIQSNAIPRVTSPLAVGSNFSTQRFLERIPIAFMSFQFAAQLLHAQTLGAGEIPTVVLTSVYMGLCRDAKFFETINAKRNKRLADVTLTIVGAIAGPWMIRSSAGISGVFWICAGMKLAIAISWLFWQEDKEVAAIDSGS